MIGDLDPQGFVSNSEGFGVSGLRLWALGFGALSVCGFGGLDL